MLHDSLVSNRGHRSCSIIFSEMREFQPRKVKLWREKSCLPKFRFPDLVNKNRGCLVWMGYAYPKLFTIIKVKENLKCQSFSHVQLLVTTWYSPLVFSDYGILQVRILGWVAVPFSGGIFWPKDWICIFSHCRQILYHLSHQGHTYPKLFSVYLKFKFNGISCVLSGNPVPSPKSALLFLWISFNFGNKNALKRAP